MTPEQVLDYAKKKADAYYGVEPSEQKAGFIDGVLYAIRDFGLLLPEEKPAKEYAEKHALGASRRLYAETDFTAGMRYAMNQGYTYEDNCMEEFTLDGNLMGFRHTDIRSSSRNLSENDICRRLRVENGDRVMIQIRKQL